MNASYININTNILLAKDRDNIFYDLSKRLLTYGINFASKFNIQGKYDQLRNTLDSINDKLVFVIGDANYTRNYALKNMLAKYLKTLTYKENKIINSISTFSRNINLDLKNEDELESTIPVGAIPITSDLSEFNGFCFQNFDKIYFFLPNDFDSLTILFPQIEQILLKIQQSKYKITTIKTFGITDKDLLNLLKEQILNKDFLITTYADNLDITITIRYLSDLNESYIQNFISDIYNILNKYIYADEDLSLYEVVYDLLKLTKKKICICESSSYALITNEFLKCKPDASKYLTSSVLYADERSLQTLLNINKGLISQYGLISVELTYELCVEMLQKFNCDYVVGTCGQMSLAKTKFEPTKCLIGIGDNEGIHVYKNNFAGNKDDVLNNIAKSAMFYLIKKIKQNDLLNQNII